MWVKAAPGVQVPKEGKPRDYITEDEAVEVPETAYYMRRRMDGDLILGDPAAATAKATAKKKD